MSDPKPLPVFALSAWADGEVTKADLTTEKENDR